MLLCPTACRTTTTNLWNTSEDGNLVLFRTRSAEKLNSSAIKLAPRNSMMTLRRTWILTIIDLSTTMTSSTTRLGMKNLKNRRILATATRMILATMTRTILATVLSILWSIVYRQSARSVLIKSLDSSNAKTYDSVQNLQTMSPGLRSLAMAVWKVIRGLKSRKRRLLHLRTVRNWQP